jgi:1-acyl-sn-glycerol-3-phosphate acyltransferase
MDLLQFFRSLLFNVAFYVTMIGYMLIGLSTFVLPRITGIRLLQSFSRAQDFLLRILVGVKIELRGLEKIPDGPLIIASKHQSTWETFTICRIVDDPAIIMKRELTWIPLFGWLVWRFEMIKVHRGKKGSAIKSLVKGGKRVIADGRQIIIFPEGTRRPAGAPPRYKIGANALYNNLNVTCVPVALNSGLYWPRRKFLRYPGTIVMQVLDPIPAGMKRDEFNQQLHDQIETATALLLDEARERDGREPFPTD